MRMSSFYTESCKMLFGGTGVAYYLSNNNKLAPN